MTLLLLLACAPIEEDVPTCGEDDPVAEDTAALADTGAPVDAVTAAFLDPRVVEDPGAFAPLEASLSEEERVRVAGELWRRAETRPAAKASGEADGDCTAEVELRYTPSGFIAMALDAELPAGMDTTTACGGDVDGSLRYESIPEAFEDPAGLRVLETSLSMYAALLTTHGRTMTAWRIEEGGDVHLCVDGGISGTFTGGAAAVVVWPGLWLGQR